MSLINTLRMYAEDMHSATGYSERSSAMSKAADMIEKFENMSACEACATIPSVMEYVQQLEQECDELKEKVARLSALLEAEPLRNERIEQLEAEVSCEEKRFNMAHEMIAELAAQNEGMREAIELYFKQYPHMMKGYILDAINSPNPAAEVLKRRDVAVLRRAAKHYEYEWGISSAGYDLLKMAAEIEKETT